MTGSCEQTALPRIGDLVDRNVAVARQPRIIVGVTGATGTAFAVRALQLLGKAGVERHLVVTSAGRRTAAFELPGVDLAEHADVVHSWRDIGSALASGSYPVDGMIIAPCSVKTLSAIAWGIADNLVIRAADVTLKERRRLVLCVRESPLHLGHLKAMAAATEMGAIIAPPMPAMYAKPTSVADIVEHISAKLVMLCGFEVPTATVWLGENTDPGLSGPSS